MKKLFLLAMACFFAVAAHSAEPRRYYYLYNIGYEDVPLSSWFEIDTERMVYTFDRAHKPKAVMRNYRKEWWHYFVSPPGICHRYDFPLNDTLAEQK